MEDMFLSTNILAFAIYSSLHEYPLDKMLTMLSSSGYVNYNIRLIENWRMRNDPTVVSKQVKMTGLRKSRGFPV